MIIKKDKVIFDVVASIVLTILSIFCLIPFLMIVAGSITAEESILRDGYRLIPKLTSLEAYKIILASPVALVKAYGITISATIIGTVVGVFVMAMTAYVLVCKDFKYRNAFSFYFYFTSIFGGGLVPWYILMIKYLRMRDNYFALILPILLTVMYILIMKSYMGAVPDAISESAKLDGAGDFTIFIKLILPLSKAALATVGLFTALNYWNDWYNCMLFIEDENKFTLQYFLHEILSKVEFLKNVSAQSGVPTVTMPSEPMKLAMTVIATGPIILLYPFVQKYFVKGITIGAVKG